MLELADVLTEFGVLLLDDVAPGLTLLDYAHALVDALVIVQPGVVTNVPTALSFLVHRFAAYGDIDFAIYPYRLQIFSNLDTVIHLADDALAWVEYVQALLGVAEPRAYVLLLLNEGELRPGGG